MCNVSIIKFTLSLSTVFCITLLLSLSFNTTPTHAQAALAFSENAPDARPEAGIEIAPEEERVIDLAQWHTGGTAPFTYDVRVHSSNPLNIADVICVTISVSDSTLTITPSGTIQAGFRPRCVVELAVTITDANSNEIERRFFVDRNIIFTAEVPLATDVLLTDISIDRGETRNYVVGQGFRGGIGTVSYEATSATLSCVTLGPNADINPSNPTISITTTPGSNPCSSLITITATDDYDSTTAERTFTVYTPELKTVSATPIADKNLTGGAAPITIPDVSQHFEGGSSVGSSYITRTTTTLTTPSTPGITCVIVTQPDGSNEFTITPVSNPTLTSCVASITVSVTDSTSTANFDFTVTVTTASAPAVPITLTASGSATTTVTYIRGLDSFPFVADLTTLFAGGTGALTFTVSSSNTNCVATNIAGNTLNLITHRDSAIVGQCSSTIKVTATDTTGATKDTPGDTVQVGAPTPFILSGANTLSDATLARGASSSVFDLSNYINGGNGDITYSATTDDNTCVTFTITGDDFTYTAHNAGTKPAQCIANIVVTATDGHLHPLHKQ